jgi:hypothetical protein
MRQLDDALGVGSGAAQETLRFFRQCGGQMKALLRWTVATYLFCASALAFAGNLPGGTGTSFWVGYNEAWFGQNYLNSLASNPTFYPELTLSSTFDGTFVDTMFAGMASGGAKIVRVWVFTALQGIVLDPSTKTRTTGLTSDLIVNLQTVITKARQRGLKVYFTALNGNDMKVATNCPPSPCLRPYFSNLLNPSDTTGRDAFKTYALVPLLNLFNATAPDGFPNRNYIYAFDLINEIEAPLNSNYFPNGWTGAQGWINNVATFVKSFSCGVRCVTGSWLPVTASAGWGYAVTEITFGLFSNMNLDFYDLHVYADKGQYSGETALCDKVSADKHPIILGEYGQKSQTYSDSLQATATHNFINGAKNFINGAKGYCFWAALAWQYEASGAQSQYWFGYLVLPKYCSKYPEPSTDPSGQPCVADVYPSLSGPPYLLCPNQTCQSPYVRPAYNAIKCFPSLNAC